MKKHWLKIVIILLSGLILSILIGYLSYLYQTKDLKELKLKYEAEYRANMAKETDSNKLTRRGQKQIESDELNYALISLQKATEIDPKFRDAWLFLGYAKIKNNDFDGALSAIKSAQEIDPLYSETYELMAIVYEKLDEKELAAKARERLNTVIK